MRCHVLNDTLVVMLSSYGASVQRLLTLVAVASMHILRSMHSLALKPQRGGLVMHEDWPSYVGRVTEGMDRKDIAKAADLNVSGVSRWLTGVSQPSPEKAIHFARSLNRNPVEALVAAGYLEAADIPGAVTIMQPLEAVSTDALLAELRRRATGNIRDDAPTI